MGRKEEKDQEKFTGKKELMRRGGFLRQADRKTAQAERDEEGLPESAHTEKAGKEKDTAEGKATADGGISSNLLQVKYGRQLLWGAYERPSWAYS